MAKSKKERRNPAGKLRLPLPAKAPKVLPDLRKEAERRKCRKPVESDGQN